MIKTLNSISYIVLILTFCALGYFGYLIFEPFTPPLIKGGDIVILNKDHTIKELETISTKVDYCVYKQVPSTTTRKFLEVDDQRVFFLSTTESAGAKVGCGSVVNNTFEIPSSIPAGKYRLILVSSFRVNPLKTVTVQYQTEVFWVK